MIRKILIANRGEIAVRVIRACRERGIATVAVYSEVDRLSLHVLLAEEAYCIGPAPARESYLAQEKLIEVAKRSGADAIHPGYGFLAENPQFAEQVQKAGLIFIGPPASACRLLGDKLEARRVMSQAGVPIVPGSEDAVANEAEAADWAQRIGYPVLLKAAAGGGGKGMRVVRAPAEMASAFRGAQSEALSAFGDPRIYLEKYLQAPRHIEFQILADRHGRVIHLGERECSIQRRHQKVIEESPSPFLTPPLRQQMGEMAVTVAKASGYQNAGTVEFMVDENRRFYFLEVNARLQVEHPVTEMVTGIDLVKAQIDLASGQPLGYAQDDIPIRGHAIESRIYAEDPFNDFLPSTGRVEYYRPSFGPGLREDSGLYEGTEVPVYYDPLIAKLIAWGRDRHEALERMRRALEEYRISGVRTTIPFCLWVVENDQFRRGEYTTHFVEEQFKARAEKLHAATKDHEVAAAMGAVLVDFMAKRARKPSYVGGAIHESQWKTLGRSWNLH